MKAKVTVRRKSPEAESIGIETPFIKLGDLLKFANIAETGGMAKNMIAEGQVLVNGQVCLQRGKKIVPGDTVEADGKKYKVVTQF